MSEPKLLPCVYCGSDDVSDVVSWDGKGIKDVFVRCWGCMAQGPTAKTTEEAARLANTRTVNVQGD